MNSDNVDWAALAQQWIKMKETSIPPAPPPPSITANFGPPNNTEVVNIDTSIPPAPPAPTISGSDSWNQWNQWQNHWGQGNAGVGSWEWNSLTNDSNGKPMGIPNIPSNIPPPTPDISPGTFVNHCPPPAIQPAPPSFGYHAIPVPQSAFPNQVPPMEYWSNEPTMQGTVPVQSFVKNMHRNRASVAPLNAVPTEPSRNRDIREKTPEEDFSTLDAVKRKQLPAWIREGLEKMEREKQKAVERERQELFRKQELEARKKIEDQAREVLNPSKSKFDSDSEKEATERDSDDNKSPGKKNDKKFEKNNESHSPDILRPRKSRFRNVSSPEPRTNIEKEKTPEPIIPIESTVTLNREEMLQKLMLKVRRSLTEILLEVTNDEINSVCKDVWKQFCNKGKNSNASISSTPVSQITRKLGLGIYGDSNSESDEENHSQADYSQLVEEKDSDEELKETLRRKQQAFRKTEAEIECRLAKEEEEEREDGDDNDEEENKRRTRNHESAKKVEIDRGRESSSERRMSSDSYTNSRISEKGANKVSVDRDSSSDSAKQCDSKRTRQTGSPRDNKSSQRKNARNHSRSRSRSRNKNSSADGSPDASPGSFGKLDLASANEQSSSRSRCKSERSSRRRPHRPRSRSRRRSSSSGSSGSSSASRRSRSRSRRRRRSRSRSRSSRRSKASTKNRRRSTRSRSSDRRSRSNSSRSYRHRRRHYRHDRDRKKSSHRHDD